MGPKPGDMTFIGADGTKMSAYLATPATGGPWPGLVVLHEAFGLTEDIRSIADRFAARGYLALGARPVLVGHECPVPGRLVPVDPVGKGPGVRRHPRRA